MSKVEDYRAELRARTDWDGWLKANSGLPGPRGNLELAYAVAQEGDKTRFEHWRGLSLEVAPVNSPEEFLVFCGVLGLWRRVAAGEPAAFELLRRFAGDRRWRTREAVAMALQYAGRIDFEGMLPHIKNWAAGSPLEQRALAAGLCEPDLLRAVDQARQTLALLDEITGWLATSTDRKRDEFKTLRQGLAYCWSVAAAACPDTGKALMEKWIGSSDRDVLWIMRENLKKNRLLKMDAAWVGEMQARLVE
ncbi:MAG: hypothetical protein AB9891_08495 [Anaerolineaceae bacterium]